jgi:hypothetical protein
MGVEGQRVRPNSVLKSKMKYFLAFPVIAINTSCNAIHGLHIVETYTYIVTLQSGA